LTARFRNQYDINLSNTSIPAQNFSSASAEYFQADQMGDTKIGGLVGDEEKAREEAAKMLRKIAARFGVENAENLTAAELNPYLDVNGEVVLPKWLSW